MTSLEKIERGTTATSANSGSPLAIELIETLKLAAPMALTQLGYQAMMTTDLAFIGRLGSEAVAAAALGGTVYFVSFTFGMGVLAAVAPGAAQRSLGRAADRVTGHGVSTVRGTNPSGLGPGACNGPPRAAISVRADMG